MSVLAAPDVMVRIHREKAVKPLAGAASGRGFTKI